MPIQQSKRSKTRCRHRRFALRYKGVQPNTCPTCGAPVLPHRACKNCGNYNGVQVIQVKAASEKKD